MKFISRIILFLVLMPVLRGAGEQEFAVFFAKHNEYSIAVEQDLKDLYLQIQNLFRIKGEQEARGCRFLLTGAVPPGELLVTAQKGYWQIEFDHKAGNWQQDRSFLARLTGSIFAARYTSNPPSEKAVMPRWIVAGILHRIESKRGSAQLMKRNQDFAVSRALFAGDSRLPDFKELTKLPASLTDAPGIIQVWTDEFSRLLLDVCSELNGRGNPLRSYTAAMMYGSGNAELLFEQHFSPHLLKRSFRTPLAGRFGLDAWNRMPPPVKVQRYLEYIASRRVFNHFHPQPVRELHKQFAAFRKINLPVPEAKPGTPPETFDMEKYPDLLENHPHAPKTLSRKIRELRSAAEGGDIEFREALQQLGLTLHEMRRDPDDPPWRAVRRYRKQFPLVMQTLKRREKIEKFLLETEERFRSPACFYEEAIRESMRRFPGETPRLTELLDKVEKQYIGTE